MQVAHLSFRVDTTGLERGATALENMGRHGQTVERSGGLIDRSMRNASGGIGVASGAIGGLATKVAGIVGVLGAGVGFSKIIGETNNYTRALSEVKTLVDETVFDMNALGKAALRQAGEFGTGATDQIKGYYQTISAGAETSSDAIKMMDTANRLAVGGVTDVLTAVDGLTSTLNAYGIEASDVESVSDRFFVTVKAGKTTVAELSNSIGKVAPIADAAGVSLNEVLAATAALTKGGVSTSVAMNGIRAAISAMLKPTAEATKLADDLKLNFNAAALESEGFAGMLDEVMRATGGSKEQLSILFGGVDALTPILALGTNASDDFRQVLDDLGKSAGATEEAFNTAGNNLGDEWQRVMSGMMAGVLAFTVPISESLTPTIKKIADAIPGMFSNALETFNSVSNAVERFMIALDGTGSLANAQAARFDGIYGVLRDIGDVIGPIVPYLQEFGIALVAVGATAGVLSLVGSSLVSIALITFTPVTLAIAAIAGGAVLLYNSWSSISAWWASLWEGLDGDVSQFGVRLRASIGAMATSFTTEAIKLANGFADSLSDGIGKALDFIEWPTAADLGRSAAELIVSFANIAVSMTNALALGISSKTKTLGSDIDWPTSQEIVSGAKTLITAFSETASEMANAFAMRLSGGLQMANLNLNWPAIGDVMSSAGDMLRAFIETAGSIANAFGAMLFSGINNSIKNIDWPATAAVMNSAAETIRAFTATAGAAVGAFGAMLLSGIGNAIRGLSWPGTQEVASNGASLIIGFANLALAATGALTNGIINAVKTLVTDIKWPSISEIGNAATNFTTNFGALAGNLIGELVNGLNKESRKFISNVEWPTIAEIAAGAAKAIVGFADLGARLVLAIVLGVNSAVRSFLSKVEWPTLGQIVSGAVTFITNLAKGAQAFGRSFLFELGKAIAVGIKDVFVSVFDFLPFVGKEGAKLGRETGEAISAATASGITAEAPQVEQAARDMYGSFKDGAGKAVPDAVKAGEDVGGGFFSGIASLKNAVLDAGKDIGFAAVDGAKVATESQSPSKALMRVGKDVSLGLAIGIEQGTEAVRRAAGLAGEAAEQEFNRLNDAVIAQRILMVSGKDALRAYELAIKGITGEAASAIIASENWNDELDEQIRLQDRIQGNLDDLNIRLAANRIEMVEGAKAADVYRLEQEGYNKEKAKEQVILIELNKSYEATQQALKDAALLQGEWKAELEGGEIAARAYALEMRGVDTATANYIASMEAAIDFQREFRDVLVDSILDADSIKDVFNDLGDWLLDWMKKQAAMFAANKLTKFLSDAMATGTATGGGAGNGAGIDGGGPTSTGAGEAAAGAAIMAMVGPAAAIIGGLYAIAELWSAGDKPTDRYGGGINQALADQEFSIIASKNKEAIAQRIQEIDAVLVEQFKILGASVGDTIFETTQTTIGWLEALKGGYEVSLQAALQNITRGGIIETFEKLGPAMQAVVSDIVDVTADKFEDVITVFDELSAVVARFTPVMKLAGLSFGETADEQAASTILLVDSMGGAEAATEQFQLLLTEFIPAANTAAAALGVANASLDTWGKSMEGTAMVSADAIDGVVQSMVDIGWNADYAANMISTFSLGVNKQTGAVILSTGAIEKWQNSINVLVDRGDPWAAQLLRLSELLLDVANAQDNAAIGLAAYGESIDRTTEAGRLAASVYDAFVISTGDATGAVTLNRAALDVYTSGLDRNTVAGEQAYQGAMALADAHGLTGVAAIRTRDGMLEYLQTLDLTSQAGRDAHAAGMLHLQSIVANENEQLRLQERYDTVRDAAERLGGTFDANNTSAVAAADSLITLVGGLDAFNSEVEFFTANFYTAAEQTAISTASARGDIETFNEQVVAAGFSAVTSKDGLRALWETIDQSTPAGAALAAAILDVDASFVALDLSAKEQAARIDTLSESFRSIGLNLDHNNPLAFAAAESLVEMAGGLDAFKTATASYYDNFYNETERSQIALGQSAMVVRDLNAELNSMGLSSITTKDQMRELIESGILGTTEAGRQLLAMLITNNGAFLDVIESGQSTTEILDNLPDSLNGAVGQMSADVVTFGEGITDAGEIVSLLPGTLQASFALMNSDTYAAGEATRAGLIERLQVMAEEAFSAGDAATTALGDELLRMVNVAQSTGFGSTEALNTELLRMADIARATGTAAGEALADQLAGLAVTTNQTGADAVQALATELDNMIANSRAAGGGAVSAFEQEIIRLAGIARAGGAGASTELAVGLERLAGIARSTGTAAGEALSDRLSNMAGIARSAGQGATDALAGGLSGLASAAGSVAGIVQQANQTLRTAGISIQQRSDAMDVLRDQGREGAGFSAGLDRVTVPELPTTIHMDEAVLRADVANAYRAMGGTATRLPDFSSNASSFTISPARDNTSRALVDEVSALRREQSEWRREQANQAKRSDNIAGAIAGGTERQTTELERLRADNKRLSRQLAKTNNVA